MFNSLATKLALKKVGLPSDALDVSKQLGFNNDPPPSSRKLQKSRTTLDEEDAAPAWPPKWMTVKSLPLTAQAWLSPPPPAIPVAECPNIGDMAPFDRDGKVVCGGGRKVLIVFLRCVGCAFAQKTFLALRTLANRHSSTLTCIAVSHSSPTATQKWIDLLGGAWNVKVVVDEDRSIYAAWGLGLGNTWYLFNPTTQIQGWKEKGWLGVTVANSVQRSQGWDDRVKDAERATQERKAGRFGRTNTAPVGGGNGNGGAGAEQQVPAAADGPSTVMGNKWQQAGAWAVDARGKVVWGGKALRADDVMELEMGVRLLGL